MKNKMILALATILGISAYSGVKAQSDDALLKYGSVLEKFVPGTYTVQLNGVGRSDIERSVKGSLKDVFNVQMDKGTADFLMGSAGNCIVEGIDNLVGQGKANDGDSVSFVYGGSKVNVFNNKTPSVTVSSGCGSTIGDLLNKYRELQASQVEDSSDGGQQSVVVSKKKANAKKQAFDLKDNPIMFTYATKMARKLSADADKLLKDKQYDAALSKASLAASIDPTAYGKQASDIKDKVADVYHVQSDGFFKKAESDLQKNNIDDAIANLLEAYQFEKKSIELNSKQSLSEEDALKVRIANYVIAKSTKLLDEGKIDDGYKFISKASALGLTNEQAIGGYKEAGKSFK
jgi:hypothetical protein